MNVNKKVINMKVRLALGIICSLVSTASIADGTIGFTTGLDYSSGNYGQTEETRITYVPFIAKYDTEKWSFKAVVPWLQIDGPGGVFADSRIVTNTSVQNQRTVESGLGDIVLGATYSAFQFNEQKLYIDVGAKVKLPTASETKGLGTGETDYTLSTDLYKTFDSFTLLGTVGYKVLGDPVGVDLENVWFGSFGGVYKIDSNNSVGVTVDLREATTNTSTGLREYTAFYSHKFNDTYKLQTYIVGGDTESSVDFGAGAMLAVSW